MTSKIDLSTYCRIIVFGTNLDSRVEGTFSIGLYTLPKPRRVVCPQVDGRYLSPSLILLSWSMGNIYSRKLESIHPVLWYLPMVWSQGNPLLGPTKRREKVLV